MFGSQTQQQKPNLFGSLNTNPTQNTGSLSLFGKPATQPAAKPTLSLGTGTQPAQTSSIFGQSTQQTQPATSNLFGQSQPQQNTSNLFGQSQPQQNASTSVFGAKPSLFGSVQQPQNQQTPSLFGSTQNQQQQNQQAQPQQGLANSFLGSVGQSSVWQPGQNMQPRNVPPHHPIHSPLTYTHQAKKRCPNT